ncbi:acyltransferase family protein [Cecembia rubra]|uniref:acyltransferase family protein n=1 Tax=Cecembia rubra TaxID=1485585 RepID=UPI00271537AD|nr:acyltransferase family protein [Cecembia rubra]
MGNNGNQRLFFLDWLRVISIFLVFLHHVFLPFSTHHEWLIKNGETSDLLSAILIFFEQWRLHLLFLVSGAGTYLAFSKRTALGFVGERSKRLLIPLYFGLFFINPPQTYFSNIEEFNSYLDLYPFVFTNRSIHHLWFIKILFVYSIIAIPLILFLKSSYGNNFKKNLYQFFQKPGRLILLAVGASLLTALLKFEISLDKNRFILQYPVTIPFLLFFITGLLLASEFKSWEIVKKNINKFTFLLIPLTVSFYWFYFQHKNEIITESLYGTSLLIWLSIKTLMGWMMVFVLIGLACKYLSFQKIWLKKINEGIYPFYIFHQTFIVILAFYITQIPSPWPLKFALILIGSFGLSVLIYKIFIYPFNITRFFFGMRPNPQSQPNELKTIPKPSLQKELELVEVQIQSRRL